MSSCVCDVPADAAANGDRLYDGSHTPLHGGRVVNGQRDLERIHTVIIGGGQSGLSVGYHLARRGLPFADPRRQRPRRGLLASPLGFAAGSSRRARGSTASTAGRSLRRPTCFRRRMKWRTTSSRTPRGSRCQSELALVSRSCRSATARSSWTPTAARSPPISVVVAMATYQAPKVPAFARDLDPAIVQVHSRGVRESRPVARGGVLRGRRRQFRSGNRHRGRTDTSGRGCPAATLGEVPLPHQQLGRPASARAVRPRVVFHRILTVTNTPLGRKAGPAGRPVARRSAHSEPGGAISGRRVVERVGPVAGARRTAQPVLADGRVMNDVANVIWCTGYHAGLDWIDLPVLDEHGEPRHERGLVPAASRASTSSGCSSCTRFRPR